MALVVWGKFLGLLVLVYVFGTKAAESADIIAEKKGLSRAFMGAVIISAVTSFPELFTGISAVTIVDSPDLAMGEIMGSCIFNLLIIALIDVAFRKNNFFQLKGKINILPMAFSFILINVLTLAIAAKFQLAILNVSVASILIFILYLFFLRIIFKERKVEDHDKAKFAHINLKKEVLLFGISSIIIIAVGIYLPVVGKEIAQLMNWNDSFVGVIFLAFVTSFPELVVSLSTARMGAFDMLLGNITGSNLFNVAIVFFIDIFYIKSAIFGSVSLANVSVGIIAMLMNFILFFAVVRRSKQKILNLFSINALMLILLYIINLFLIY
jgi:cation:H+ antiporter